MKLRIHQAAGAILVLIGLIFAGCTSTQNQTTEMAVSPEPTQILPTQEPTPTESPYPEISEADFYFGVDLSYVNEMDDCGAEYRENGELVDAYDLFSEHGANLVRARLWVEPDWTEYSTVTDIERTFARAKEASMATLLDFHYSDNWADPGNQDIPEIWKDVTEEDLPDVVYQYTYDVLMTLNAQGLMPEFVQVGNETNAGLLKDITELDWPRDARLFNAGIKAVRDAGEETGNSPKIILHVAQPENAGWWFTEATESGITDFDIIGLSYYPQWSSFSVADVGGQTTYLRETFGKDVMIVETAYPWTFDKVDETADNILNQGVREYSISIEGQRQFMLDLTQSLISNGGLGVIYWEPAWVSTQCSTRWGQGSHWENATFFDFENNNEVTNTIDFLNYDYIYPPELVDGVIDSSYGAPLVIDEAEDNLDQVPHLDLLELYAKQEDDSLYLGLTIDGDPSADPWGSYAFYFDTTQDERGAQIDVDKHPIIAAEPYYPEYRLDVIPEDRKGTVTGSYAFYGWDGEEWQMLVMTGGEAIRFGAPTTIELQIPESFLGSPEFVNIAVVSIGRGRVHTAGDILGTAISPTDWNEPVVLENFYRLDL
jgi:arabinogalactan endo-1,4-beta-galactosidase